MPLTVITALTLLYRILPTLGMRPSSGRPTTQFSSKQHQKSSNSPTTQPWPRQEQVLKTVAPLATAVMNATRALLTKTAWSVMSKLYITRRNGSVLSRVVANLVKQSLGRMVSGGTARRDTLPWISNSLVSEYARIWVSFGGEAIVLDSSGSKVFAMSRHTLQEVDRRQFIMCSVSRNHLACAWWSLDPQSTMIVMYLQTDQKIWLHVATSGMPSHMTWLFCSKLY